MMAHGRGARGEEREIRAALLLQPQLVLLDGLANLIVRDGAGCGRGGGRVLEGSDLRVAEFLVGGGRRRVVTVTIDDHGASSLLRALRRGYRRSPEQVVEHVREIGRA